ncbi:MAG: hypothetical protein CML51_00375 [Rhodobacteraceae bacterium]|nr:hypothetical protein [Paracoccaceae bacterium]
MAWRLGHAELCISFAANTAPVIPKFPKSSSFVAKFSIATAQHPPQTLRKDKGYANAQPTNFR